MNKIKYVVIILILFLTSCSNQPDEVIYKTESQYRNDLYYKVNETTPFTWIVNELSSDNLYIYRSQKIINWNIIIDTINYENWNKKESTEYIEGEDLIISKSLFWRNWQLKEKITCKEPLSRKGYQEEIFKVYGGEAYNYIPNPTYSDLLIFEYWLDNWNPTTFNELY